MKKGEDAVQELINFLKERISLEDDILKCLGKSLNRVRRIHKENHSFHFHLSIPHPDQQLYFEQWVFCGCVAVDQGNTGTLDW
jgi:hypothetical protein